MLWKIRDEHAEEEKTVEVSERLTVTFLPAFTDMLNTKLPMFGDASSAHRSPRAATVIAVDKSMLSGELDNAVFDMLLITRLSSSYRGR